jgi:NADH:ubiquinone oxidoreductase subunit 6 (subunit J)
MKTVQKIFAVLGIAAVLFGGGAVLVSQPVFAATSTKQEVCEAIGSEADCSGNKGGNLTGIIKTIVNILSVLVGVVAIIMIIWAGFKYVTSGGDSNKVTSAKNALIYALIGLIIVALAQLMVRFVLAEAKSVSNVQYTVATIPLK